MIGVLAVSHSPDVAKGIGEMARAMSRQSEDFVRGVGGNEEGGLGNSVPVVLGAITEMLAKCEAVVVIPDMGSSVLATRSALAMMSDDDDAKRVVMANAPILEGTMLAAVEASAGSDLETVLETARDSKNLKKTD